MPLLGKWTQHLSTQHERDKFTELVMADRVVLDRLLAIIEDFERELDQSELSLEEYKNPAFPFLKADRNGELRALRKIKKLVQSTKE